MAHITIHRFNFGQSKVKNFLIRDREIPSNFFNFQL